MLRRLATGDGMQLWVAEADGQIVSAGLARAGRRDRVRRNLGRGHTAGVAGRGIYRALTAARARSALALGKRLMHSDSTEFSRPILERAGLVKVSATTPCMWRR